MHSIVPADYKSLTGPQKAAILILAIGDVEAGKVFALLHEDEIREVSKAMVQLGPIPAVLVERLSSEFAESVGAATGLIGGIESTERMLAEALALSMLTNEMMMNSDPHRASRFEMRVTPAPSPRPSTICDAAKKAPIALTVPTKRRLR